jgi:hypothetical protein
MVLIIKRALANFYEQGRGGWGGSQKPIQIISNFTIPLLSAVFGCVIVTHFVSFCDISFICV